MATQNLTRPLSPPQLHPVFYEIVGRFIPIHSPAIQPPIAPPQSECCYTSEFCDCRELATVHHLETEQDLCARHWRKVVRRG
jgi:hypothetical protein